MRSVPDDLTSAAAIRTAAMTLFATRGFTGVTVRDIASEAGVSPPLVMHHYGSKEGLRRAVDDHALGVVEAIFELTEGLDGGQDAGVGSPFADLLEREPAVTSYLRRLLVDGGPRADELFARLYRTTVAAMSRMRATGLVNGTEDDAVLDAFLLVNDLGAMILREQLRSVIGVDPLARPGIERWARTVLGVYGGSMAPADNGTRTDEEGKPR